MSSVPPPPAYEDAPPSYEECVIDGLYNYVQPTAPPAVEQAQSSVQYTGPMLEQWVRKVKKFSSQYDNSSWNAGQLCGTPKVYPAYGDMPGSWAVGDIDAHQFVEVEFEKAVQVVGIEIYETFHAGGTKRICALNENSQWITLWETEKVSNIDEAMIFSPPLMGTHICIFGKHVDQYERAPVGAALSSWSTLFAMPQHQEGIKQISFKTKDIRIEVDCTAAGTWVEIDAIKLIGKQDGNLYPAPQPRFTSTHVAVPYSGPTKEQWAYKVKSVSSQYDSVNWKAECALGEPRVYPKYGDYRGVWATGKNTANEFIELEFEKSVYVVAIHIYETYHAGAVKKISALNEKDEWVTLWQTGRVSVITEARIFSPAIQQTSFKTKNIHIEVDCTVANSWVEIDAVKLIGKREEGDLEPLQLASNKGGANSVEAQWIHKVNKFSSQYNDGGWSANKICGKPKVYPEYGDKTGAWAPRETNSIQYVEVEIEKAVYIAGVEIYETYHAGGVCRIAVKNPKGQWVIVWETDQVSVIKQARIFTPRISGTDFKSKYLKIEIDCTAARSWVELDAIRVLGNREPGNCANLKIQQTEATRFEAVRPQQSGVIEQWVKKVKKFSSQYDDTQWPASCLCGKPKVYPRYGDIAGAWATSAWDDKQFAEVMFKTPVQVTGIEIYETYHAGGVKRIQALAKPKRWVTLWETRRVENIAESRIFSPSLKSCEFATKVIRIEIDCTVACNWVEIDAIKLIGKKDNSDDTSSSSSSSSDSDSEDDRKKSERKKKSQSKSCSVS